jgi:broad specificity phosphatase PhoE
MGSKVLYLIRHGQAEHNLAASKIGYDAYKSWEYMDARCVQIANLCCGRFVVADVSSTLFC